MSGRHFLLDTNIIIAFFKEDQSVIEHLSKGSDIFLSSIVLGELYFGAENSKQQKSNFEKIDRLASLLPILTCDLDTAKCYGKIKNKLKSEGTPIPENDIWIAALADQYEMNLVTRDNHFKHIERLKLERW